MVVSEPMYVCISLSLVGFSCFANFAFRILRITLPGLGVDATLVIALENRLKSSIARVHVLVVSFLRGGIELRLRSDHLWDSLSVSGFGAWLFRMKISCDDEFCNPR